MSFSSIVCYLFFFLPSPFIFSALPFPYWIIVNFFPVSSFKAYVSAIPFSRTPFLSLPHHWSPFTFLLHQLTCKCGWGKSHKAPPLDEELHVINDYWEEEKTIFSKEEFPQLVIQYWMINQKCVHMSDTKWPHQVVFIYLHACIYGTVICKED